MAASLPYLSVLIAANTSSAFSAFTPIKTFPSLATSYGSIPNISDAALTASLTGIASSLSMTPTPDLRAISFMQFASPPRVGSFIAVTPPTSRALEMIPHIGATSDFNSVSNPKPSLKDIKLIPWSPTLPVIMILSPTLKVESLITSPFLAIPIPVVTITIPSSLSCSITLVSPVMTATSASSQVSLKDFMILSKSSIGKPSCKIIAFEIAKGFAPITETSFIVPAAEILPISPPGKNNGFTV